MARVWVPVFVYFEKKILTRRWKEKEKIKVQHGKKHEQTLEESCTFEKFKSFVRGHFVFFYPYWVFVYPLAIILFCASD